MGRWSLHPMRFTLRNVIAGGIAVAALVWIGFSIGVTPQRATLKTSGGFVSDAGLSTTIGESVSTSRPASDVPPTWPPNAKAGDTVVWPPPGVNASPVVIPAGQPNPGPHFLFHLATPTP